MKSTIQLTLMASVLCWPTATVAQVDAVFANSYQVNRYCSHHGAGAFTCADLLGPDAENTQDVAIGDFNRDTLPDVAFANTVDNNRVCLRNRAWSFNTCMTVSSDAFRTKGVAVGDLDSDGAVDLIFANETVENRMCFNDGAGTFT